MVEKSIIQIVLSDNGITIMTTVVQIPSSTGVRDYQTVGFNCLDASAGSQRYCLGLQQCVCPWQEGGHRVGVQSPTLHQNENLYGVVFKWKKGPYFTPPFLFLPTQSGNYTAFLYQK